MFCPIERGQLTFQVKISDRKNVFFFTFSSGFFDQSNNLRLGIFSAFDRKNHARNVNKVFVTFI
jgi:hypothetical protein